MIYILGMSQNSSTSGEFCEDGTANSKDSSSGEKDGAGMQSQFSETDEESRDNQRQTPTTTENGFTEEQLEAVERSDILNYFFFHYQ